MLKCSFHKTEQGSNHRTFNMITFQIVFSEGSKKLRSFIWQKEGHVSYLCSYVRKRRYNFIKQIIDFYGMKYTEILCREKGEQYSEIVERIKPDILIEDDCKSIGGQKEWCITNVREETKAGIYSIIVPEFNGIDDVKIDA